MPPTKRRERLRRVRWSNRTRWCARVERNRRGELYSREFRLVRQLFGGLACQDVSLCGTSRGSAQAEPVLPSSKTRKVPIPQKNCLTNRLAARGYDSSCCLLKMHGHTTALASTGTVRLIWLTILI